jgi:hypothetical protein
MVAGMPGVAPHGSVQQAPSPDAHTTSLQTAWSMHRCAYASMCNGACVEGSWTKQ